MKNYAILVMALWGCCIAGLSAQNTTVALGEWRSHLAYGGSLALAESEDAVFFASGESILKVYKADQSLEYLNKVSGLSDMRVQTVHYHREEKLLIIAYLNGNLDLVYDNGTVVNIPAILLNNVLIDKSIHSIYTEGKKIYFSCAFGLTIYDLDLNAFSQTTFTPVDVFSCTRLNNQLFIATAQGIYRGIEDGRNLLDFNVWEKQTQNLPTTYGSDNLIRFNGKVYADVLEELYVYDQGTWSQLSGIDLSTGTPFTFWRPTGNGDFVSNHNLSLSYNEDVLIISNNSPKYFLMNAAQEMETRIYGGAWRLQQVTVDQDGNTWAADQGYLHRNGEYIKPNAPSTSTIAQLHTDEDGTLWVASSSYNTIGAFFNKNGFLSYKEADWTTHNHVLYPQMDTFWDVIRIVSNPVNNKIYVGSFMSGLLEYDPATKGIQTFDQYTPSTPLQRTEGDNERTRIQGIAVDADGNVWMTMTEAATNAMAVLRRDGSWKGISLARFQSGNKLGDVVIDGNGYKWVKQITGNITVYDSGNLDDDNDDRAILLTPNNSVLPTKDVLSMVVDKEGAVWVGTTDGVAIFDCPSNIFDGNCRGTRPIISKDNFNGFLLEGEEILSMAVDGANRKWVGTNNGVFLLSGNDYSRLLYLNEENSPLFDNEVRHLAVDDKSGYVYIGTSLGLQSVRGEATAGQRRATKCTSNIFPNPVEPGYDGPIAISNLPTNASVKITDSSGRLMYETTALGGQAIWNGSDYTGRRAQSGVYFAFFTTPDGGQKGTCKILFLN